MRFPELRSFVTVTSAAEVLETPTLMAAYASKFGPDDDATLIIYASDRGEDQLARELGALVEGLAGAGDDLPDVLGVADPEHWLESAVSRRSHARLSRLRCSGPFEAVPCFGDSEIDVLRELALREWAMPDRWLWQVEQVHAGVVNRSPPGDHYSPIPNTPELAREPRRSQVWPAIPAPPPGIDWREEQQIALCNDVFARQQRLQFSETSTEPTEYVTDNDMYGGLDGWVLEAFLRHLRPRRLIEIGSGFSTLITDRVNRELLAGGMQITCVEPYPRDFLTTMPGIALRVEQVQDTPVGVFDELEAGDVLFIDSSHVVKTGSDARWEYLGILPRLSPGVVVHVHDIFFPRDYPKKWVMEGWGWNEQYMLQAFLVFNNAYEVVWGTYWMLDRHRDTLSQAFPGIADPKHLPGASFWIRRL
jgi:hypothetical protein